MGVAVGSPMTGVVVVTGEPVRPGSLWQRVTASRTGRVWLIVVLAVVVLAVVSTANWSAAPRPEATLQSTGAEADSEILSAVSSAPLAELDSSTLHGYEPYRGVQPWSPRSPGSRCLMAIVGSSLWGIRCAPLGAELLLDYGAWPLDRAAYADGLVDGTVIRLQHHGDWVDTLLLYRRRVPTDG